MATLSLHVSPSWLCTIAIDNIDRTWSAVSPSFLCHPGIDDWFSYSVYLLSLVTQFSYSASLQSVCCCHPLAAVMHLTFLVSFACPHHCVRLMFIIECRCTAAAIHVRDWMWELHLRENDVSLEVSSQEVCYSDALHFTLVIIMLFVMIILGKNLKAVAAMLLTSPCHVRTWRKRWRISLTGKV